MTKLIILEKFEAFLAIQRFSPSTVKIYSNSFSQFYDFLITQNKSIYHIDKHEAEKFILYKLNQKVSHSYQINLICAIEKFCILYLNISVDLDFLKPKRQIYPLPKFITQVEVKKLIAGTNNIKHKCIIQLLYSSGIRLSELINLEIVDVLSDKMLIRIKNGKGRYIKDLLGHVNLKTTEIYTHVTDIALSKLKSPLDTL